MSCRWSWGHPRSGSVLSHAIKIAGMKKYYLGI